MRPGRLDSLIYIGLPDWEARVSIIKACLRKSPYVLLHPPAMPAAFRSDMVLAARW